jgi:effector-binding domain-containing protein
MRTRILTSFILLMTAAVLWADDKPAAKADAPPAGDKGAAMIGEPREQTLASRTILFASRETTFDKLLDTINDILPKLMAAVRENKTPVAGSVIFIYHGVNPTDNKPFTLDIGIVVEADAKAAGDFKVKKLEPFRCDTILLSGPVSAIGQAYEKLMPAVMAKKHEPIGEVREAYLYWEGPESANNVVQIQMGIK